MVFSKYIDNFTPFPPLLDSNMFSSLLQKRNKFMKPRGGWRGGRGVLLYQNQVIIFQEVQLYIFSISNYNMDQYFQKIEIMFDINYKNIIKGKSVWW